MRLRSLLAAAALALASLAGYQAYATAPDALGGSAFPLTYITQPVTNPTDGFNEMLQIINAQTVGISSLYTGAVSIPTAGVDSSGVTFSTNIQGNPLMQLSHNDVVVSTSLSSVTMATLVASESGRTLYPAGGLTIMVSGTAATATGLALECSDGTLIASWPIADLVTLKAIGIGLVNSTNGTIGTGAGLATGCPVSTAIMLSDVGSTITTTTHVYVNAPYTVQ